MIYALMVCASRKCAGLDSAWEQNEARKMLENAAEPHMSGTLC